VRVAQTAGVVKGRDVAIDGTKIQANASKHRATSDGRMTEELERLEQDITDYLRTMDATDPAEDAAPGRSADGRRVPEALADAGYCSDAHLEALETRGIDAVIPPEKVRHRAWRPAAAFPATARGRTGCAASSRPKRAAGAIVAG
jgi:hypothetical protein